MEKLPAIQDFPSSTVNICPYVDLSDRIYVEIISTRKGRNGVVMASERHSIPKYDMSKIDLTPKLHCSADFDPLIYAWCLKTKEGKEIINDLKNIKTNNMINGYAKEVESKISISEDKIKAGHGSVLRSFLDKLINAPLCDPEDRIENKLDCSLVGLRKEEIWNQFKEKGLINKIKQLKNKKP